MSFLKNIFQKQKTDRIEKQPKSKKEKPVKKTASFAVKKPATTEKKDIKKQPVEVKEKAKEKVKKVSGVAKIAPRVLSSAHITEKAAFLAETNQYVFRVKPTANKTEVKKAVGELYNVNIVAVNMVNVPRKAKRLGRSLGFKGSYKKALVTLEKGQTIELLPR